jgi:hypothetical protein
MCRLAVMLGVVVLTVFSVPARADNPSADGQLTPEQIRQGWLSLFDGETTFGWHVEGEARIDKGKLVLGGKKPTRAHPTTGFGPCSYRLSVHCKGSGSVTINDTISLRNASRVLSDKLNRSHAAPVASLVVEANTEVVVDYLHVRPEQTVPLFNGKDLTGWKVFKDNPKQSRSIFSVTKEGWLNVKDGPGDLQTEQLFDDFVLQLECRSNGKHLNSGIFFRCQPGKYQQGYEVQIRNQFTESASQKYTVEEYDPSTHKLLSKKVVLSPAVDFGTGAIYRRMPARKGVARDGEWFTLTLVARGRHLATWVDDVQVVDWTDNRPASDNARQGFRAAAGAISIQGHDPTTDLSFRNFRIVPLRKK